MTSDSDIQPASAGAIEHLSASGVLRSLAEEGYDSQFVPQDDSDGALLCASCRSVSPAGGFRVDQERRLEGASDPDDMVLIVATTCPQCGAKGAVSLGFGPEASAADADVIVALDRRPAAPGPGVG